MSQIVIGTAGHIDHGKTTLVEALTGTNTDRLLLEQERGMTIDLGFAFLTDDITIIDVPGHERFIRNMVAGVSTIDIALVTIAADDGIMPQTREHIDILCLLGLKSGVIALTKVDLIADPDWLDLLEEDIRDYVKDSFLENAPLVRVSGETGGGVEELRTVLLNLASEVKEKSDRGFFRLHVDREFTIKGFGTIVTGTVVSGSAREGDELEILPQKRKVKIRSLQSHGKKVSSVTLGDRAALNLSNVDRDVLKRGSQVVAVGFMNPTTAIGAEIALLPRSGRVIKDKQRIRVHIGTEEVMGRVFHCANGRKRELKAGNTVPVLLRLENQVAVAMDDPLILRFYSPPETIGGGVIVDPEPPRRWRVTEQWLKSLACKDQKARMKKFLESSMNHPLSVREWAQRWQLSREKILQLLHRLDIVEFGASANPHVILSSAISNHEKLYLAAVEKSHQESTYRRGIPRDELRQHLGQSQLLFDFLTERLHNSDKINIEQGLISRYDFHFQLSADDQALVSHVEEILRLSNLTPPTLTDLANELDLPIPKVLPIMHILKDMGKVQKVDKDLWFHTGSLGNLESIVRNFFDSKSSLPVSDFKAITNTTRKHAIPLLEYLDRREVTRREGDLRVLNS